MGGSAVSILPLAATKSHLTMLTLNTRVQTVKRGPVLDLLILGAPFGADTISALRIDGELRLSGCLSA